MLKKIIFLLLYIININYIYSQEFLPKSKGEIVKHTYFTLSYSEKHEQPYWVYYILNSEMLNGKVTRKNNFRPDPDVKSGSAQISDYQESGFDRGHLVPAADMGFNQIAMNECFYFSNMSPQDPDFNRGIWKDLEVLVRKWAKEQNLYIVVGGILTDSLMQIGVSGVDVPNFFYKIIYSPSKNEMIAFILPNKKVDDNLLNYVVNVNLVEEKTKIDFFPQLPNKIERLLEGKVNIEVWSFN